MFGDQWLGAELAGYRIDALVGHGGVGVVYRATHLRLQRPAALKLLAAGPAADVEYRRRFEREARLAAGLEHPHIVPIYDAGYAQDVLYLAMRFIDGPNLLTVIDEHGPMAPREVCELLTGVAEALDSAHHAGLVHRDVKPANVLIGAAGRSPGDRRAYLCDFGIARHTASSGTLTAAGQFLGTLQYCAPEQIQGRSIDGRADQYALACVVFHCLTGRVPYPADELSAVMFGHISADPPRVSALNPALPAAADHIIARALAKQPDHRFPDCATFLRAVATIDATAPMSAPAPTAGTNPQTLIWPPAPDQPAVRRRNQPAGAEPPASRPRYRKLLTAVLTLLVLGASVALGATTVSSMINPITVPIPVSGLTFRTDGGLAITADGRRAYVVGERSVSVIDIASNAVTDIISVPVFVGGKIAITPDGRYAYITKSDNAVDVEPDHRNLVVIDTVDNSVAAIVPVGGLPREVVITPDGRHAYVTVTTRSPYYDVVVVDTASNAVIATVSAPDDLDLSDILDHEMVIAPDGRHIYLGDPSRIVVISAAGSAVTTTFGLEGFVGHVAVAPDGRHLYATTKTVITGAASEHAFVKVDTGSGAVVATIPLSGPPEGIVTAPDGRRVYVLMGNRLLAFDPANNAVATITYFSTGYRGAAITPDGRYVYAFPTCYTDPCDMGAIDVGR